jgi:hypothetical protein
MLKYPIAFYNWMKAARRKPEKCFKEGPVTAGSHIRKRCILFGAGCKRSDGDHRRYSPVIRRFFYIYKWKTAKLTFKILINSLNSCVDRLREFMCKPLSELGFDNIFCQQASNMGYKNLEDILSERPSTLLYKTGPTHQWLDVLSQFLEERGMSHLLHLPPGRKR